MKWINIGIGGSGFGSGSGYGNGNDNFRGDSFGRDSFDRESGRGDSHRRKWVFLLYLCTCNESFGLPIFFLSLLVIWTSSYRDEETQSSPKRRGSQRNVERDPPGLKGYHNRHRFSVKSESWNDEEFSTPQSPSGDVSAFSLSPLLFFSILLELKSYRS